MFAVLTVLIVVGAIAGIVVATKEKATAVVVTPPAETTA